MMKIMHAIGNGSVVTMTVKVSMPMLSIGS